MKVTPQLGRRGDAVAHIENSILCVFDRRHAQPRIGTEIDVMISATLWRNGPSERTAISLIVRPVTEDDINVQHRGFECAGQMCSTTASLLDESRRRIRYWTNREISYLTPGRADVIVADNVNVGWHGRQAQPLTPGLAYISRHDIRNGHKRIAGVPDLSALSPEMLNNLRRRTARAGQGGLALSA